MLWYLDLTKGSKQVSKINILIFVRFLFGLWIKGFKTERSNRWTITDISSTFHKAFLIKNNSLQSIAETVTMLYRTIIILLRLSVCLDLLLFLFQIFMKGPTSDVWFLVFCAQITNIAINLRTRTTYFDDSNTKTSAAQLNNLAGSYCAFAVSENTEGTNIQRNRVVKVLSQSIITHY